MTAPTMPATTNPRIYQPLDTSSSILRDDPTLPADPGAPGLSYVLCRLAEYSPVAADVARRLASAYKEPVWGALSLEAWGCIEAGKACLALYETRDSDVKAACQWVYDNAARFRASAELLATVDLAGARSLKRGAAYPAGLELVSSSCRRYEEAGLPGMVAVAQVPRSWLLLQLGNFREAAQGWEAAHAVLKDTEDWTNQGNIQFAIACRLCRAGVEDEGRAAYREADNLYSRCEPPHRNLRRTILRLADLEHRMAFRDPGRANELRDSAAANIARVEKLLDTDPTDVRNRGRLFLAKSNQALGSA
jgi:tetratricopeptide (TPR) repeat protein